MRRINWNKKYTTISVYAVIVFLICFSIYKITDDWITTKHFFSNVISVLSPFLLGMLIAYFMNPLVNFIENKFLSKIKFGNFQLKSLRKKRFLSILISYFVFFSLFFILLGIIIPQLISNILEFINAFPNNFAHFMEYLKKLSFSFNGSTYSLDIDYINSFFNNRLPSSFENLTKVLTNIIPSVIVFTKNFTFGILNVIVAIIISIYLLSNKESGANGAKKTVIALFPSSASTAILETAAYSHKVFSSFFIGKVLDSVIIGILCFFILVVFKIPFALLISVIVGITNVIPYFGPFIGGGIGFIFLLIVNPVSALGFLIIVIILQQFDGNILGPKILGDSIGLSPFWIIFSIILFGSMFGFIGMLLGAPFFSIIKTLFDRYIDSKYNKKQLPPS